MENKILIFAAVLAALFGVGAMPAKAQVSRLYFAGYLGLNTFSDSSFTESGTSTSGDLELDNATSFAGALGLRLDRSTRLEVELSRRKSDISSADFSGNGSFDMGGDITSTFAFLSLYHDFDMPRWKTKPYLGAGLGFAFHEGTIVDGSGLAVDATGDDTGFAYHIGGGLKHRLAPDLALTGGYRYVGTADVDIGGYQIDYSGHEFRVGLEWDFSYKRPYGR